MAGNFFRGTSVEQDGRFGKSDEKLLASMSKAGKFSAILETKVNLKKVNLDVMSKWITAKIIQLVGFEDDILINLVINMLEGEVLDPKKMQLDVTGFLEKQAQSFVEELWTLLVDAQNQQSGIPMAFIEKKKEEILLREEAKKQQQQASLSNAQNAPTKYGLQTGSAGERREDVDKVSDRRAVDRNSRRKEDHRNDHRDEHHRRDSRDDDQYRRHRRGESPSGREGRGGDRDSRRRDDSKPRRRDRSPERSSRNKARETPSESHESHAEKVHENGPTVQSDARENGRGSDDRKANEKRERSPDRHRRHDSRDRRSHRDGDRRHRRADSSEERRHRRSSGDRRESRRDGRGRSASKERGERRKDVKKRRRSGSSSSSSSDDSLVPL